MVGSEMGALMHRPLLSQSAKLARAQLPAQETESVLKAGKNISRRQVHLLSMRIREAQAMKHKQEKRAILAMQYGALRQQSALHPVLPILSGIIPVFHSRTTSEQKSVGSRRPAFGLLNEKRGEAFRGLSSDCCALGAALLI